MFSWPYVVISLVFALANIVFAFVSLRRHDPKAQLLAAAMISAAITNVSYLVSIAPSASLFLVSFSSSVYFASIDFCLLFFFAYTLRFTELHSSSVFRVVLVCCAAYGCFDVLALMSNPVTGVVLSYEQVGLGGGVWQYVPGLLFLMHLAFCYIVIGLVAVALFLKAASVPSVYRLRYLSLLMVLFVIVALNAVFLYFATDSMPDVSVLLYSVMCFLVYQMAYGFRDSNMVREAQSMILRNMETALVLFDYEDRFAYCNESTGGIIPERKRNRDYTFSEFVADCSFNTALVNLQENASFQWKTKDANGARFRRCDYQVLKDEKDRVIGKLFVFFDSSLENDLLTGFQYQSSFERALESTPTAIVYPFAVIACDIDRLAQINSLYGRDKGDLAIQALANVLRDLFGKRAYYLRSSEATLVVIAPLSSIKEARHALEEVRDAFSEVDLGFGQLSMEGSVVFAAQDDVSLSDAIALALDTLGEKKLLDPQSSHSSLLDSFAQTLMESDLETDSHVRRTQLLGRRLGERLGLSESELTSLDLLCLLHDIGKVGIPMEILNKPGRLTDSEWQVMKSHVEKGYRIANASPELQKIAPLILHHHEFWNGMGYPDGLSRESIPLLARILSVVDTFDAMTNDRPYRPALSVAEAKEELARCANVQFDPIIVGEFLALLEEPESRQVIQELSGADRGADDAPFVAPKSLESLFTDNAPSAESCLRIAEYSSYSLGDNMRIVEIDDAFTRMTGYTAQDVQDYGLTQLDLLPPEDRDDYLSLISSICAVDNEAYLEHRIRRKNGSTCFVFCYGRDVYDAVSHAKRARIVISDCMESRSMQIIARRERISARRSISMWEDSARRDPLTGLFNREALRSETEAALLKDDGNVLFLILDVDFFKTYNDTYGHPQGDELLKVLASGLSETVFPSGIAARMGGDEFAASVYMPKSTSLEHVHSAVKNTWERVSSVLRDYDQSASVSLGASYSPSEDRSSFARLYREADKMLYEVKKGGGNNFRCF
ncbi:MAG: diguanylate cyclase domain-containing protein [Eggerthellaceae bacterium]